MGLKDDTERMNVDLVNPLVDEKATLADSTKPRPTPRISPTERNWQDLAGFVQRTETVPTNTSRNIYEQFILVTNGGSSRFYIYEPVAASWRYTQLS